jgi:methylated-DNA-[protein]-cysteine S-methyltransferase
LLIVIFIGFVTFIIARLKGLINWLNWSAKMQIFSDVINHSDLGSIFVYWGDDSRLKEIGLTPSHLDIMAIPHSIAETMPHVEEYLHHFTRIDKPNFTADILDLDDFTPFYRKVYKTLFDIPKGISVTYGELAEIAGYKGAYRAVGTAMSRNRFLLVIPCHRVVGVNSLGGFTTGLATKIKLLELEGIPYNV